MTSSPAPDAPPKPYPERNEDAWLAHMAQWTELELKGIIFDSECPSAAKMAARQRLSAMDGNVDRSGKPMNGPAFDRVVNRTLGKPREDPKIVINQTKILHIGTEHLFDNITAYLAGEDTTVADFRLDARPELVGPDHGEDDPQEPTRERSDPPGDPPGGGG